MDDVEKYSQSNSRNIHEIFFVDNYTKYRSMDEVEKYSLSNSRNIHEIFKRNLNSLYTHTHIHTYIHTYTFIHLNICKYTFIYTTNYDFTLNNKL